MKILLVNKFHWLKGGSEKYYFEVAELLKQDGHEVAFFSMKNEKNVETGDKEYFVEQIDLNSNNKLKALEVIYSKKNKKLMQKALEEFKPDVVHINNFQRQLSASIIKPCKKRNIPVVFTIELSNGKIADTICEATKTEKREFYTCHNISIEQFEQNENYLSLMKKNLESLKFALR